MSEQDEKKNAMEQAAEDTRLQVRTVYHPATLHVQGVGEQVNREYGLAVDVRAIPEITDWLAEQERTLSSPASGQLLYVEAEFYEGDEPQLLVVGNTPLNHERGALLNLDGASPSVDMLRQFAGANDLVAGGVTPGPDAEATLADASVDDDSASASEEEE